MIKELKKYYVFGKENRRLEDELIDKRIDFEKYKKLRTIVEFSRTSFLDFYFESLAYYIGVTVQEGPLRFLCKFGNLDKYSRAEVTDEGIINNYHMSLNPFIPSKRK